MKITARKSGNLLLLDLSGRMDGTGSAQVSSAIQQNLTDDDTAIIFDMGGVDYISSAGLRVFQECHRKMKERKGSVAVCGLQEFTEKILTQGGFLKVLVVFPTANEALARLNPMKQAVDGRREFHAPGCTLTVDHFSNFPCTLMVKGSQTQIHDGMITAGDVRKTGMCSGLFCTGIGAPAQSPEEAAPVVGEMICLDGSVYWLPTDGNLNPDFFTASDFASSGMACYSVFCVSGTGPFRDIIRVQSESPGGVSLSELYGGLFRYARETYPDYTGVCAIVMKASIGGLCSRDMKTSLLAASEEQSRWGGAPNPAGKTVMEIPLDRSVTDRISTVDVSPRYAGDVMLVAGYGIDPAVARQKLSPDVLSALLYQSPGTGKDTAFLYNRGAVFKNIRWDASGTLESQLENVQKTGEFVALHNLLSVTTIKSALVGLLPISSVRNEP